MTPEELDEDEPVTFEGGVTADLTPEGTIVYTFEEPRDLTDVVIDTPEDTPLEVVPMKEDGTEGEPIPLDEGNNPINPAENPDAKDVTSVIISRTDDEPIESTDITNIEVVACEEGRIIFQKFNNIISLQNFFSQLQQLQLQLQQQHQQVLLIAFMM